jgi:hypothetical protein
MLMGMSEAGGGHLASGIGFASAGAGSITIGIASLGNGPVGIILGIINIGLGVVDLAFAANEIAWEITGTNYMQKWCGVRDELDYALGAVAMTATTVMIIASMVHGMHYQAKQAQQQEQAQRQEPSKKEIAKMRKEAVEKAKAEELKILKVQKEYYDLHGELPPNKYGDGWGSLGNMTETQAMNIISKGNWKGSGFDGHHIKSVDLAKAQGDFASIKNPNNIAVGDRWTSHFQDWHGGNWANQTDFIMVNGVPVTSINRTVFLNDIQGMFGGR